MRVPVGSKDVVAVVGFQSFGHVALPLVDDDMVVLVDIAQHVVAGNGVATVADDVAADGLLVEDEGFLLVDDNLLAASLRGCFLALSALPLGGSGGGLLVLGFRTFLLEEGNMFPRFSSNRQDTGQTSRRSLRHLQTGCHIACAGLSILVFG